MKVELWPFLCVILLCGCTRAEYRQSEGAAWGTTYHIVYKSECDLADSVVAEMRRVELSLSSFDKESTVSLVNANVSDCTDPMFEAVFAEARRVSNLSGGAFDPTVGPLVDLWGFGRRGDVAAVPDSVEIAAALAGVGISRCSISAGRVVKASESTQFDFSAIAKGFGVDAVAGMLERNGVVDYMVEIGGEVRAEGVSDKSRPWRIQIDAPVEGMEEVAHTRLKVIELGGRSVATSGNYRNYRDYGGLRVGHTISPVTGRPVATATLSATVIAPSCMTADALATACMAMPVADALAMIESQPGVEALLVVDNSGAYKILQSSGFPD